MNRHLWLLIAAPIALFVIAPVSFAQDSTEQRLQTMERQLQQALQQLDEQRRETKQAQQEIGELRSQLERQQGHAPTTGRGRAAVVSTPGIDRQIDQKVRAAVAEQQAEDRAKQQQLETQVAQMKPAWDDYARRWLNKFKISTLFYGDWAFYKQTGFGPQFLTQLNPPGPGNNNYNSFDITRAYINLFFTPDEDFTFRVTPNIFRAEGGGTNVSTGKTGGIGSNLNGNLSYRLKYGYIDWNTPFKRLSEYLIPAFSPMNEAKITFGQQPNPLIDWEENLYGYRFTSLVPWNYLSLSSTQVGIASKGPIKFDGLQYLDYDLGVYNNANFHQNEQSAVKSGMVRVSAYPLGARSRFDGLGITGFYQYGFPNTTPDVSNLDTHIYRTAALLHYSTDWWSIAGEYDQGRNAFTSSNLFSGSGPADEFNLAKTPFADFDKMVKAIQNNDRTTQQGVDVFGHVDIVDTPFSVFGLWQLFYPNTQVHTNPLDFQRIVGGFGYKYSSYLRLALDVQYLQYLHSSQFTFPVSEGKQFGLTAPVKDAVPSNILAVFMNVEFNY
jgi:hypothetical protein